MSARTQQFTLFCSLLLFISQAQLSFFSERGKWGLKEKETVIVSPKYDTLFGLNEEKKLCLACDKHKSATNSKIIRTTAQTFHCNYLNSEGKRLIIKTETGDTCSVFGYGKNTVKQFTDDPQGFTVATLDHKKYLVARDFTQLTFKGYYDVNFSVALGYYTIKWMSEQETIYAGLINSEGKDVVPHVYSNVHINPADSLITGCRSGFAPGSEDDVLDYKGKIVSSHKEHVEMPTKNFVVYKIFEPKVRFVVHNMENKEEYTLKADEIYFYEPDQLLVKYHDKWFVHDLKTNTRKETQM